MSWRSFTRGIKRGVSRGVKSAARAANTATKGIKKGVQAVRHVVAKTGLLKIAGTIIGTGLGFVEGIKEKVEKAIGSLPFGQELILIAKLTNPELMAMEAFLANGQALEDFVKKGELDVKGLALNAIQKRVPGWDKMDKIYGKFEQTKALYAATQRDIGGLNNVKIGGDYMKDAANFFDDQKNLATLGVIEGARSVDQMNSIIKDNKYAQNTEDQVRNALRGVAASRNGALKGSLVKPKKATADVKARLQDLINRRR